MRKVSRQEKTVIFRIPSWRSAGVRRTAKALARGIKTNKAIIFLLSIQMTACLRETRNLGFLGAALIRPIRAQAQAESPSESGGVAGMSVRGEESPGDGGRRFP